MFLRCFSSHLIFIFNYVVVTPLTGRLLNTDSRYKEQGLAQKATCWWLFGVVLGCVEAVEAVGAIGWRWWRLESDFDNNG